MREIDILLKQLHLIDLVNELKEFELVKVFVSKQDNYHFYLQGDTLLSFEEYRLFSKELKHFPYPATFSIECLSKIYRVETIEQYINYFKIEFINKYPTFSFLNTTDISFSNDTITLSIVNEAQRSTVNEFIDYLTDQLAGLGLSLYIKCVVDLENEDYKKLKEEIEAESLAISVANVLNATSSQQNNSYQESNVKKNTTIKPKYRTNEYTKLRINEISQDTLKIRTSGYVFKTEIRKFKTGKHGQTLFLTDYTDSIMVKRFERGKVDLDEMNRIGKGNVWVEITGNVQMDQYSRELVIMANTLTIIDSPEKRKDSSPIKRVELHTHSKMSTMDGISTVNEYISRVASWGHTAFTICDHGNVQSFPEAQAAASKNNIKMIYGVEMNVIEPYLKIVRNAKDIPIEGTTFVCFDLETTGLSVVHDKITEFGAVKIRNGEIIDRYQTFINPEMDIPSKIVDLTGISNEMVKNAKNIKETLPEILKFFGDDVVVAHNANFDIGFLNYELEKEGKEKLSHCVIDTLNLARAMLKPMKSYRLGNVARNYKITYDEEIAHRADYDADVLANALNKMLHEVMERKLYSLKDINHIQRSNLSYKQVFPYHMTLLAKNKTGLRNMFKLVSESNTTYYHEQARIPRELINKYRDGLLVGSSCYKSDVFEAALNLDDESLKKAIEFYDYIEIQPLEDYYHLVDRGSVANEENLRKSIIRIIDIAEALGKIIVGTGDVHFIDPEDKIYREVFISNPTIGISHTAHPLCNRKNPRAWTPNQYLRTTAEFLRCFKFLNNDAKAYEYVVTNTNKIADMIEELQIIHTELYKPTIEGADQLLTDLCYKTAYEMYGNPLPTIVENRLTKELENIIKHGFGVIYYIAHKLVNKSNEDGYLVGSRGSVGSSFVATLSGITEVNPLQPHYRCPKCTYSEFYDISYIANGFDLPDKDCPECGHKLIGDGHFIPFETFLGFEADKVPDIDLNFSGDYQAIAHEYTKELFGEDKVYRAGTISTVADKTAYGYAKGYKELLNELDNVKSAELERIASGCTGVKRTTGQHPGGIIVIPNEMDVYDFTPVQYPADDLSSAWRTTHFDFHAIHDNVLKLDILGHVDPTVIRMLQDKTGIDPQSIPMNDELVISLFNSTKALGIDLSYINCSTGALGLPEFGTTFVRGMLEQTKPQKFSDLVIISGLSHGTDVYLGNAELLIKSGTKTLSEVIGCRDDIMVYLMEQGVDPLESFKIMEFVRKGFPGKLKDKWKEWEDVLKENNIETWYIESLGKIKYMFPKAHAVAYVTSSVRVAWWKLYYPAHYYAVYFTTRCDAYEIETMVKGKDAVLSRRKQIASMKMERANLTKKDEDLFNVFDICLEMFDRGFYFSNIDLNHSSASEFLVDANDPYCIIPPFTSIDGLGEAVGETIVTARNEHEFLSKEDVISRTKLNNTHIKQLTQMNVFSNLQDENQISLFNFM